MLMKLKLEEALAKIRESKERKFGEKLDLQMKLNKKFLSKDKSKKPIGYVDLPNGVPIEKDKIAVHPSVEGYGNLSKVDSSSTTKLKRGLRKFKWLVTEHGSVKNLSSMQKHIATCGLTPCEKTLSLTGDIDSSLKFIERGRQKIKISQDFMVYLRVGLRAQDNGIIKENVLAALAGVLESIGAAKELLFEKVYIKSTMSPAFEIDHRELL